MIETVTAWVVFSTLEQTWFTQQLRRIYGGGVLTYIELQLGGVYTKHTEQNR